MDWSLALVSQGIETTIERPAAGGSWALLVPASESERTLKTLRQYHVENRDFPWRQQLPWPETHFDWASALWICALVVVYWISGQNADILNGGIMDSAKVVSGQWWRVFTAMTLHADLAHLATNLSIGIVLFGLAMGQYGTGTGLLAAYLAGAGGNITSLLLNAKPFQGLGASGMIMGALGLLAAQSLTVRQRAGISLKHLLSGMVAGVMLFVLFGLAPGTDMAAHLGGFVTGFIIGAVLARLPAAWARSAKVNFASGVIFVALVTATWRLAFDHR
jgi:membrane associated rhomboid family serine protease